MTRKAPFSGKAKKQQLLAKRLVKAQAAQDTGSGSGGGSGSGSGGGGGAAGDATGLGYDSHLKGGQTANLEGCVMK
jgi:hypothetical protein